MAGRLRTSLAGLGLIIATSGSLLAVSGCGAAPAADSAGTDQASALGSESADKKKKADAGASGASGATGGQASADFRSWLTANGYGSYNFPRDDIKGGSFGGKTSPDQTLSHIPIVFVHGNTDSALGTFESEVGFASTPYTGWTDSVAYFTAHGYTMAELYGTTWGPADENQSANQEHSRDYVQGTRAFLEAVMAYTGSDKVDVIGHSMGVTIARGAIYGGTQVDSAGTYSIGSSLGSKVDTFIGISAANQGLTLCFDAVTLTVTCNATAGFFPGVADVFGDIDDLSTYLGNLHKKAGQEGDNVFAIFSLIDEVIGDGDIVYGQYTSRLEKEDGEVTFDTYGYGHVGVKDLTGEVQYDLVTKHTASGLNKP